MAVCVAISLCSMLPSAARKRFEPGTCDSLHWKEEKKYFCSGFAPSLCSSDKPSPLACHHNISDAIIMLHIDIVSVGITIVHIVHSAMKPIVKITGRCVALSCLIFFDTRSQRLIINVLLGSSIINCLHSLLHTAIKATSCTGRKT
jgi:hypothetical protein